MTLTVEDLDFEALGGASIVWTTGTGLSEEPSRTATLTALDCAAGMRIHDLDYRPVFWPERSSAKRSQLDALRKATIAVGNVEECALVVGEGTDEQMAARLLGLGLSVAVIKKGPEGVSAFTHDLHIHVDPIRVQVVNGLGAGDAFGGALCHGLLAAWPISEVIAFANAAGAHVAGQLACADAMPDESTVRSLLERHGSQFERF
jgi:5-dehydro-2-deoxygluconokinase